MTKKIVVKKFISIYILLTIYKCTKYLNEFYLYKFNSLIKITFTKYMI